MVRARVIREVKEEAVLDIEISGLLGVCTDPRHVVACADGGVRQEFDVTYCVRPRLRDHAEGLDHAYLG